MKPRAVDRRVETGRLVRIHPGVYRVGSIRHPLEAEMAATLALGEDSVVSHRTAADLHKLFPSAAKNGLLHVTVPGRQAGPKRGVYIHRTKHLPGDEQVRLNGIPVTAIARTTLDLAPFLRPAELEQLIAAAHHRRPANTKALEALIARYPRRPGVPAIRAALTGKPQFTRSKSERRILEALRRAGFNPEANVDLAGHEVDLYLPEHRLVIEVDGGPFHSSRPDRRRDYARDAGLQAIGVSVLRVDADQAPERVIALVAGLTRSARPVR